MAKKGLEPIIHQDTEILILGSLPGEESLRQQKYYANKGNDFWKLTGDAIGEELDNKEYPEKLRLLKEHKIGLWDVFRQAERKGSGDSEIRYEVLNDFSLLEVIGPNIRKILFNGKTRAGKYEYLLQEKGYDTAVLPSSSGANRQNRVEREKIWKQQLQC